MATIEETVIRPALEFGPVLTSRSTAELLRRRIENEALSGAHVTVDFAGVEAVSPSFADEIFAKIDHELVDSGHIRFENLSDDLLALVRFVVSGRQERSA